MLKVMKVLALVLFAVALALPMWMPNTVEGQAGTEALTTDMDAKTPNDLFNGFGALGTPIDECVAEPEPPTARGNGRFEDNKFIFSERETVEDGLGPTYNDVGCVECHQSVDVGAFSQTMEFRAGHITNGAFVDLWSWANGTNQKWIVSPNSNGTYTFLSVNNTGYALDCTAWGTSNGTTVEMWSSSGGSNQQWNITETANGIYKVTPAYASGIALDVSGASNANGTQIQLWQDNGTAAQQWSFIPE